MRAPRVAPIAPTLSAHREQGLAEDYERRWYVGCPLEVRPVPNKGRVRSSASPAPLTRLGPLRHEGGEEGRSAPPVHPLRAPCPLPCSRDRHLTLHAQAWAVYETYKQTTCRYCLRDRAEGAAPYEAMCTHCKDTWYCSAKCQQLDEARARSIAHVFTGCL